MPVNVNYRYVADELRYIFDNAEVVALVFERAFAADGRSGAAPTCPRLRHFVVVDDGSRVERATTVGGGRVRGRARGRVTRARLRGPRSADDLYILYTGGTTGMPKGVMWRAEDIFFAAIGGGGFGPTPIETARRARRRGATEEPARQPRERADDARRRAVGRRFITFYGGGTVVLYTDHHFDADEIWRIAARSGPTR